MDFTLAKKCSNKISKKIASLKHPRVNSQDYMYNFFGNQILILKEVYGTLYLSVF